MSVHLLYFLRNNEYVVALGKLIDKESGQINPVKNNNFNDKIIWEETAIYE